MSSAKKTAYLSCFLLVALAVSYAESFIPAPMPGIKLGLANSLGLLCLHFFGYRYALALSFLRVLLSALLFASPISALYGAFGVLASVTAMLVAQKLGLGALATSALGGVCHNGAQIAVACLTVSSVSPLALLPVLCVTGFVFGVAVGALSVPASALLRRFLPKEKLSLFEKRDAVLLVLPLVASLFFFIPKEKGELLSVSVGSEHLGSYPLSKDARIEIEGKYGEYVIVISEGEAYVLHSGCPNGDCLRMRADASGGSIICLPERIVAKVENGDIDAVVG